MPFSSSPYAQQMATPTLSVLPRWNTRAESLEEYLDSPLRIRLRDYGGRYEAGWYLEAAMDDGLSCYEDDFLMFAELDGYEPPAEMVAAAAAFNANPRAGWLRAIQAGFEETIASLAEEAKTNPDLKYTLGQLRSHRTRLLNKLLPDWKSPAPKLRADVGPRC